MRRERGQCRPARRFRSHPCCCSWRA
jgi:hypothetical protein